MSKYAKAQRTETLDYIQMMLGQLRTMAEAEQYEMLAFQIEMAYIEASDITHGAQPSRIANKKGHSPA